ncbi:MAG: hypothetical protein SPF23_02235 [Paludibacteraceae bacterium]|nr:hypothetical protein [Paludibacteraceae bacterium]
MKRIFTFFAAALTALSMSAASYGILVNGKTYFAGEQTGEFEGFTQYLAHVQVKAGDFCQLCNGENQAVWAVDINPASVEGFTRNGNQYSVTTDGCYDFYIKLKYEADELYIGPGSNCGEGIDISGGGGGGEEPDDVNYYAMGWINAADAGEKAYDTYDDNLLFVDGKLTIDCQYGSYIGIKDYMCNYYYFRGEDDCHEDKVTLEWANGWSPCKKWAIPEGVNYIIMRSATYKGNIVLERVDKATYDAYHFGGNQAIENTPVTEKARKVFIDGQLRIIRGDKMFDATGRQL